MATVGFPSPATNLSRHRYPLPHRHQSHHVTFRIRNSAADTIGDSPSESPVETKRSSSLISPGNIQKALRGIAITNADHYGRLGIAATSSYDQVNLAYESKCRELMSRELGEEEASKELELLKESYGILSCEEERRLYDWSLARSQNPDRYVWPFQVDIMEQTPDSPPPKEPEDDGPTQLVGYSLLAWFILAAVLSLSLHNIV